MKRWLDIMSDVITYDKYRKAQQKKYGKDIKPFLCDMYVNYDPVQLKDPAPVEPKCMTHCM